MESYNKLLLVTVKDLFATLFLNNEGKIWRQLRQHHIGDFKKALYSIKRFAF